MKARMNIRSIIMIVAIIGLASMFFINICFAADTGKIITETARLREQPQTDAKVLELLSQGEEVEVIEEVNGWNKVKYKNVTGYIRSDLIKIEKEEAKATATNNTETENIVKESSITEKTAVENTIAQENKVEVNENITVGKGKYRISENAKLKIIPLISSIEINEVNKNNEVEVIEILNDWAKIKTTDGIEGWLRIEKLIEIQEKKSESNQQENTSNQPETTETATSSQAKTKTMYVNSQTVNLRQKADKTSQVIKQLEINTKVTVISTDNEWTYVDINGTKGYISNNLLSGTQQETARSAITERNTTKQTTEETKQTTKHFYTSTEDKTISKTGNSIVAYAKQFLGCKYVYGGTTTSGFDCSGFTQFVYKHYAVNLNRTAAAQYSNGTATTDLQAGDLVMFGKSGIDHVGIYIGENTFIHAANPCRGVTTDTLASGYYKTNYVGARRIF